MQQCALSSMGNYGVATGVPSLLPLQDAMMQAGAIGCRNMGGGGNPTSLALVHAKNFESFAKKTVTSMKENFPDSDFVVVPIYPGKASRVLQVNSTL